MKHANAWTHLITMSIVMLYTIISSALVAFKIKNITVRTVAVIVLVSAVYLAVNRNTYLPFLGDASISPIIFAQELAPAGSSTTYELKLENVEDGTRVFYWASSQKDKNHESPQEAYQGFENTGITSVKNNRASLKINCPDTYDIGTIFKRTLDKHIHYRLIRKDSSMMSQVHTVYISC